MKKWEWTENKIIGCVIGVVFIIMIAMISMKEEQTKVHRQFMIDKGCFYDLYDKTLDRKGCMDKQNNVYWRE